MPAIPAAPAAAKSSPGLTMSLVQRGGLSTLTVLGARLTPKEQPATAIKAGTVSGTARMTEITISAAPERALCKGWQRRA
jgi:hypothetical protein